MQLVFKYLINVAGNCFWFMSIQIKRKYGLFGIQDLTHFLFDTLLFMTREGFVNREHTLQMKYRRFSRPSSYLIWTMYRIGIVWLLNCIPTYITSSPKIMTSCRENAFRIAEPLSENPPVDSGYPAQMISNKGHWCVHVCRSNLSKKQSSCRYFETTWRLR